MFENPGGKLRIIVRIIIYICMIASVILSFVFLGGFGFLAAPVLVYFLWVAGLFWLLKIDQADDIYKIRRMMEEKKIQPKPVPKTTPKPAPKPEPKPEGKIIYPAGAEVVYCPSCGKSQHAGSKKCFSCGAEIRKVEE